MSITPPPALGPAAAETLARQSGQVVCRRSQASTHAAWNRCPHCGSARVSSPSLSSAMHTAHSPAAADAPFPFSSLAPARTTKVSGSDATRRSCARFCWSGLLGGDVAGVEAVDDNDASSSSSPAAERLREKSLQK
jgi:hypothetical protein